VQINAHHIAIVAVIVGINLRRIAVVYGCKNQKLTGKSSVPKPKNNYLTSKLSRFLLHKTHTKSDSQNRSFQNTDHIY
jgi:hypothetical protein